MLFLPLSLLRPLPNKIKIHAPPRHAGLTILPSSLRRTPRARSYGSRSRLPYTGVATPIQGGRDPSRRFTALPRGCASLGALAVAGPSPLLDPIPLHSPLYGAVHLEGLITCYPNPQAQRMGRGRGLPSLNPILQTLNLNKSYIPNPEPNPIL